MRHLLALSFLPFLTVSTSVDSSSEEFTVSNHDLSAFNFDNMFVSKAIHPIDTYIETYPYLLICRSFSWRES